MSKIRSIKPETLDDEIAAALSDAAWRLWISTWLLCDDHGNFRSGSRYLASRVWQGQDVERAEAALAELVTAERIFLYEEGGQRYGHVNGWSKHQRIDNAAQHKVPVPNDTNRLDSFSPRNAESDANLGSRVGRARSPAAGRERSGREGNGVEGIARGAARFAHDPPISEPGVETPKAPSKGSRKTRIPDDFHPSPELIDRFRTKERVDCLQCLEKFKNHFTATGATMVKWQAAFTNWVLRDIDSGKLATLPAVRALPPPSDEPPREVVSPEVMRQKARELEVLLQTAFVDKIV